MRSSWRHSRGKAVLASARPSPIAQHLLQQVNDRGWGLAHFRNLSPRKTQAIKAGLATNSFPRLTGGEVGKVRLHRWAEALRGALAWLRSRSKLVVGPRPLLPCPGHLLGRKETPTVFQACMCPPQETPNPERTPSAPCKVPGPVKRKDKKLIQN